MLGGTRRYLASGHNGQIFVASSCSWLELERARERRMGQRRRGQCGMPMQHRMHSRPAGPARRSTEYFTAFRWQLVRGPDLNCHASCAHQAGLCPCTHDRFATGILWIRLSVRLLVGLGDASSPLVFASEHEEFVQAHHVRKQRAKFTPPQDLNSVRCHETF